MKRIVFVILFMFLTSPVFAAHEFLEREYQAVWCAEAGGIQEYRLDCGARVDCLTDMYAVEFDFGMKWAESIGQALYYGLKTGKSPGVVLILEKQSDEVFLTRLRAVAKKHGIKVWIMDKEDLRK